MIQELNQAYRGIDAPTDVLSFSQLENTGEEPEFENLCEEKLLGDIVISVEFAEKQSAELGHSLEREIAFLTVHGLLHLLGFDHKDVEGACIMQKKQEEILERFKFYW